MACYFLLFWFIITLHDRTGRLEIHTPSMPVPWILHDRTGRLEKVLTLLAST